MSLNPWTEKQPVLKPYQRSEFMSFMILIAASASISGLSMMALGWLA